MNLLQRIWGNHRNKGKVSSSYNVTFQITRGGQINDDVAFSDESVLKNNGDKALNDDFS